MNIFKDILNVVQAFIKANDTSVVITPKKVRGQNKINLYLSCKTQKDVDISLILMETGVLNVQSKNDTIHENVLVSLLIKSLKDGVLPAEKHLVMAMLTLMVEVYPRLTHFCVCCGDPTEFESDTFITCGKDKCIYKSEEMAYNDFVVETVKGNEEMCSFLIEISLKTLAVGKDKEWLFNPFPTRFMKGEKIYERGDLNQYKGKNVVMDFETLRECVKSHGGSPKLIQTIKECQTDSELKGIFKDDLYYLVRFILQSNKMKMIKDQTFIGGELINVYKVIHTPQIEGRFKEKNTRFYFHGSPIENWHSIIRNGLKVCSGTEYQKNGAAHGSGIYLSEDIGISLGYTGRYTGSTHVVAVCEVLVDNETHKYGPGNHRIVTVKDEMNLIIRYLIVVDRTFPKEFISYVSHRFQNVIPQRKVIAKNQDLGKGHGRLIKELEMVSKAESGLRVEPRDDNLFLWDVYLTMNKEEQIAKDMEKRGIKEVHIEVRFPKNYPVSPPFIRIISPRFDIRTGHITTGGSICLENLTTQGHSPVIMIENILIGIQSLIIAGGGKLDPNRWNEPYNYEEAKQAFERVAKAHGWY